MAIAGFSRTAYHGSGGAGQVGRRIAYITRSGEYAAEARIRHQGLARETGRTREDLVFWNSRNLPSWTEGNPTTYFTAAERYESAKNVAYEEWKVSLPRELTRRQQVDAARDFLHAAFGTAHPYVWAFHAPVAQDQGEQPHLHVISSSRTLDEYGRSPAQFFRRYNRHDPEAGGAAKDRAFSHFGAVKAFRELYTDTMNLHLEAGGYEVRLHPDSLQDREIDREPEPKLQPSDSNAYRRGVVTDALRAVLEHRARRAHTAEQEAASARIHWQFRQLTLGIEPEMSFAQKFTQIRAAREHVITQQPARPHPSLHALQAEVQRLEQSVTGLERYGEQVRTFLLREERMEQLLEARDWRDEAAAERCLAEGKHHGLEPDPYAERTAQQIERYLEALARDQAQEQIGGQLHIRLQQHDRERDHDRGLSW